MTLAEFADTGRVYIPEIEIDPDARRRLIEALRSGQYKQAKYGLHSWRGGHCVLGVVDVIEAYRALALDEHELVVIMNDVDGYSFEAIADALEAGHLAPVPPAWPPPLAAKVPAAEPSRPLAAKVPAAEPSRDGLRAIAAWFRIGGWPDDLCPA